MSNETSTPVRKIQDSDCLCFDHSVFSDTSRYYGSFSLPVSEVAVIGEWTNQDGPGLDDWFLVAVPRGGGGWFEASMYARRADDVRTQFSAAVGESLQVGLAYSTDFASRIIWPPAFAERPLFTFRRVTGSGFLRRLKLLIVPEVTHDLSPDALSAIEHSA